MLFILRISRTVYLCQTTLIQSIFQTQKRLALAALAVVSAASAQSSVTISGKLDFSAITTGKTTDQDGTKKDNATGLQNNMTTGQISFAGTEDLGGGLKASFVFNSGVTAGAFGDRDKNLALQGGFGTVRIGRFIPAAAQGFAAVSGYVATSIGSIDDVSSSGDLTGNADTAGSYQRQNGNIQYTSPTISGFTLNANYATNSSDISDLTGELKATQTGLGVAYANGPLNVAFGINSRDADKENAGSISSSTSNLVTSAVVNSKSSGDLNWIGASYDLGVAKLFASHVMREDETSSNGAPIKMTADIKLTSFGVQVPMGAFNFAASAYTGKDDVSALSTDNLKMSGNQISVTYALSKRTYLYALNGTNKVKLDSGNTGDSAYKITKTSLGVVHSF